MQSTCLEPGCESPQRSRRLCKKHYLRHYHQGTLDRFPVKVKVTPPCEVDGCPSPRAKRNLCEMHYARVRRSGTVGPATRLHASSQRESLDMRVRVDPETGCWIWTGCLSPAGYGFMANGRGGSIGVHRAAYEIYVGPIPDGLDLDHLCRTPACCNPAHLEPVTRSENVTRALPYRVRPTHCKRGHLLAGDNLIPRTDGARACRACADKLRHERKKPRRAT